MTPAEAPGPIAIDVPQSVRQSDFMQTDLTSFQRNFRAARAAADRGETVRIISRSGDYIFTRATRSQARPFADLLPYFGVVNLRRDRRLSSHEAIGSRLRARRPG